MKRQQPSARHAIGLWPRLRGNLSPSWTRTTHGCRTSLRCRCLFSSAICPLVWYSAMQSIFIKNSGVSITHFSIFGLMPPRGKIFDYLFVIDNYPISMPTAIFRKSAFDSLSSRGLMTDINMPRNMTFFCE